ncbi:MAG: hypothetical protein CMJ75_08535 [Planctomycetaceae bacterium]|nr:hypothetical protein [Planctomycetaceae bacterium]
MNLRIRSCCIALLVGLGSKGVVLAAMPLQIRPTGDQPEGFHRVFNRQVDVFGLAVYATSDVPATKLMHAAGVLAQYLDNDADGLPDNPRVIAALRKSQGLVFMFPTHQEFEKLDLHRYIPARIWNRRMTIGLFAEETLPAGSVRGQFDATLEEVLHLVTAGGYSLAYPEVFGERPGTRIATAMDKARGGFFRRVPRKYPPGAWYSYDDRSCSYRCQITEYFYWGLTSLLDAQNYPGREQEIRREWKLNTPEKLKKGDPLLFRLLTDPQYRFPRECPDGKYRPQ